MDQAEDDDVVDIDGVFDTDDEGSGPLAGCEEIGSAGSGFVGVVPGC